MKSKRRSSSTYSKKSIFSYGLVFDIICSIALVAVFGYMYFVLLPLGALPKEWLILGGLVGVIVLLVNLILALLKMPTFIHILRRVIVVIICGVCVFGAFSISRLDTAMEEVIKMPTSYKEYISVITLRDSKIIDSDSLKSKYIGVQRSIDTDHMDLVVDTLESEWGSSVKKINYDDYTSAVEALYAGKISAMIISESYRELIEETYTDFKEKTAIIDAVEIENPISEIRKDIDVTKNSFTILVSGIDTLGKAAIKSPSDVNMLITVNPLSKMIVMNSIPRDSYLPNACLSYQNDKLTHTGLYGTDCTIKTIENAFDVEINYYAKISFSSVINVINELGGIEVDVPMSFCERKANRTGIMYIDKGLQTLTGEQALALARHRYTLVEGDLGRAKNQQLVINAIIKKALSTDILSKLDGLVEVVGETVQTNITKKEIYDFASFFVSDLSKEWTLSNHVVSGSNGWGECASLPGRELSIVELSEEDVDEIKYVIKMAETDSDLSDFSFSVNSIVVKEVQTEGETSGAVGKDYCHLK
ncbi:MAG: LCP family protein [Erysipelotrichales bacterium]|nr:LCP family protein [Erysipelotrichales bacterium]